MTREELRELSEKGLLKGIYDNISNEVYHSCVGLSKSGLLMFDKDPVKFHYRYILGNYDDEKTEALKMGTLIHEILLEPEHFDNTYKSDAFALQLGSRATNKYKNAVEDYCKEFPNRVLIKEDEMVKLQEIKKAVYANPVAKQLLEAKGKVEQTIFWTDPMTGILCKCRLDKLITGFKFDDYETQDFIVEIKSTTDVFKFDHSIAKYKYYLQYPWYRAGAKYALGLKNVQPLFIAIDKEAPYHCRIGQLSFEGEGLGELVARDMLNRFDTALKEGFIPKPRVETFDLPEYEFKRNENKVEKKK